MVFLRGINSAPNVLLLGELNIASWELVVIALFCGRKDNYETSIFAARIVAQAYRVAGTRTAQLASFLRYEHAYETQFTATKINNKLSSRVSRLMSNQSGSCQQVCYMKHRCTRHFVSSWPSLQ